MGTAWVVDRAPGGPSARGCLPLSQPPLRNSSAANESGPSPSATSQQDVVSDVVEEPSRNGRDSIVEKWVYNDIITGEACAVGRLGRVWAWVSDGARIEGRNGWCLRSRRSSRCRRIPCKTAVPAAPWYVSGDAG